MEHVQGRGGTLSKSVQRRRNRRTKTLAIAFEMIESHGVVSTEAINQELGKRRIKSSVQYVGIVMRKAILEGRVERVRWGNNRSAYRFSIEE